MEKSERLVVASGKEYGKLTADQFKELIDSLPELRKQGVEFRAAVAAVPAARLDELLTHDYNWADVYELSFQEHLALVVHAFNMGDYLKSVFDSPDPQTRLADDLWTLVGADTARRLSTAKRVRWQAGSACRRSCANHRRY